MNSLLAALIWMPTTVAGIAIAVVSTAAICALVLVALNYFEIKIPGWVQQVFWILVVACVIIFAIRLVAGV